MVGCVAFGRPDLHRNGDEQIRQNSQRAASGPITTERTITMDILITAGPMKKRGSKPISPGKSKWSMSCALKAF